MHEENDDSIRKEATESEIETVADEKQENGEQEEKIVKDKKLDAHLKRKKEKKLLLKLAKDVGIIVGSVLLLAFMFFQLLTILGFGVPARPLVVSRGAARPFFLEKHRTLIEDGFDGTIRLSENQSLSVILLYSPYSSQSKRFREEYYEAARLQRKLRGADAPYFGATNCFDFGNDCRQKHNLKQYPALMAQNYAYMGSVYNGPLKAHYVTRWLNRLQNAVFRVQTPDELVELSKKHDLMVILFYQIRTPPTAFQSAANFTKLAYHYLDGDPNSEKTIFCIVTDPHLASQFQIYNEHDVVIVSSELKLLYTHYKGWTIEGLYHDLITYAKKAELLGVEMLNLGRDRFSSTQLAQKIDQGSVLLFFTQGITYGSNKYSMFRETARDYHNCPANENLLSESGKDEEGYVDDCSVSLKSAFCDTNTTLSFMMIDSRIEHQLASIFGAEENDVVVAVNAAQEITRFIRENVTRETINCLVRQHHNTADNKFVIESSKMPKNQSHAYRDNFSDAVGEASVIKFVDNVGDLLRSRKINVILFSGGIWHSSSSSAIAPFHLLANYFRESKSLIEFSMVDVSQTYVPYNLDFEELPKVLITSADSVGLSWVYPEDFMINYTNIANYVLTRPGKVFGRLRWLDSCRGQCRKRARVEMQNERSKLQRALSRNVLNSQRQRAMIGYYNRMLHMMG